MSEKPTKVQVITLVAVSLVVAWAVIAFGCVGMYGDQYRQFGRELGRKQQDVRLPAEYKYVADMETGRYWPRDPEYVEAIPAEHRVYILDDEALEKFKGYRPGPL